MKLLNFKKKLNFSVLFSTILSLNIPHLIAITFDDFLSIKQSSFICKQNHFSFLSEMPIDENQDIIKLSNLELYKPKPIGGCTGGIYRDANHIYYVKQSNPFTELLGAKLMNYIVGEQFTPVVKIVIDEVNYVASLELPNFITARTFTEKCHRLCKNAIGEADLDIVMDFLGIVDRHDRNVGYVLLPHLPPFAARIDFDTSFAFETNPRKNADYNPNSNHLCLNLLIHSIKKHPKAQFINSMKKLVSIPDEEIVRTIMQSYVSLSQLEFTELEPFLTLANKLLERKKLFRESLKSRKTFIYKQIQRRYFKSMYKTFNRVFLEIFPFHFSKSSKQFVLYIHNLLFPNVANRMPVIIIL